MARPNLYPVCGFESCDAFSSLQPYCNHIATYVYNPVPTDKRILLKHVTPSCCQGRSFDISRCLLTEGLKTDFSALFSTCSAIWTLLFCTCPKVPRACKCEGSRVFMARCHSLRLWLPYSLWTRGTPKRFNVSCIAWLLC